MARKASCPARPGVQAALAALASGLIDGARILFFVSPFLLSLPQLARAESDMPISAGEHVETIAPVLPDTSWTNPAPQDRFGPFRVITPNIAELNGVIDDSTPDAVRRMLASFPGLGLIRMIDCPGTENDAANMEVARMIRKAGISTYVPNGGSVRSGGVDLFLAGAHRTAEPGAEFGVHSWEDVDGREARDVPEGDPSHLNYLLFYEEMGMTTVEARAFYAFTNRAAFDDIHYMTGQEMAQYRLFN